MKSIKILGVLMLIFSIFAMGVMAEDNQTEVEDNTTEVEDNTTTEDNTTEEETTEEEEEAIEVDEATVEEAGVGPDSPIRWGLERAMERIDLALTFNKSAKAQKGLAHARERLAEVQMMIAEKKLDKAEKAQEAHGKALGRVKKTVENLETDGEDSLETELEIEEELADQEKKIKEVKTKIKARFTAEEQEELNALLGQFQNSTQEVKIKVQQKKEDTKVMIKAKEGKSSKEVESIEAGIKSRVKEHQSEDNETEEDEKEVKSSEKTRTQKADK